MSVVPPTTLSLLVVMSFRVPKKWVSGYGTGAPAQNPLDARNDSVQVPLGESASDSGVSGQIHQLAGKKNRAQQNRSMRGSLRNSPGRLDPIQTRHEKVEHDQVRRKLLGLHDCIFPVRGFATDFPIVMTAK